MIAAGLRWLADKIDPPQRRFPDYPMRVKGNVFDGCDDLTEQRREDSLALHDAEALGYLLVVVRDQGAFAKAVVTTALADEMWPAVKETLCRIVLEAERVYGR